MAMSDVFGEPRVDVAAELCWPVAQACESAAPQVTLAITSPASRKDKVEGHGRPEDDTAGDRTSPGTARHEAATAWAMSNDE